LESILAHFRSGHLAVRTRTWREYLVLRDEFEERSLANLENVFLAAERSYWPTA
jgi:hypothetical protein